MAIEDLTDVKPGDYFVLLTEDDSEKALYRVLTVRRHPTITLERIRPSPEFMTTNDLPTIIDGTVGDEKFRKFIKLRRAE